MRLNKIITDIKAEIDSEKRVMSFMESRSLVIPNGSLQVLSTNDGDYYRQRVKDEEKALAIYLDSYDDYHREVIKELMEKKTIVHGLPILRDNIKAMEKCVSKLKPYDPLDFKYGELLGKDYYLDDDVCVREWEKKPDRQNPYHRERLIHETKCGIKVRSKSEMLIADILYDLGIRFKYETILVSGRKLMYPDFEFIHPKERRIIWLEHQGLIDDPKYAVDAFEKQDNYGRIGIFPGKNLILTHETNDHPLTRGAVMEKLAQLDIV